MSSHKISANTTTNFQTPGAIFDFENAEDGSAHLSGKKKYFIKYVIVDNNFVLKIDSSDLFTHI